MQVEPLSSKSSGVMHGKIFAMGSILLATIIAALSLFPQQALQMYAAYGTHFFVGLVPILAAAALIKYVAYSGDSLCGNNNASMTCCCCNNRDAAEKNVEQHSEPK